MVGVFFGNMGLTNVQDSIMFPPGTGGSAIESPILFIVVAANAVQSLWLQLVD